MSKHNILGWLLVGLVLLICIFGIALSHAATADKTFIVALKEVGVVVGSVIILLAL